MSTHLSTCQSVNLPAICQCFGSVFSLFRRHTKGVAGSCQSASELIPHNYSETQSGKSAQHHSPGNSFIRTDCRLWICYSHCPAITVPVQAPDGCILSEEHRTQRTGQWFGRPLMHGLGMAEHRVPRPSAISLVERLSERAAGWLASIQPVTVTLSRGRVLSALHYLSLLFS